MAILNLFDPETGMPLAIIDATAITDMRTGAVTAIGAKHLARGDSRILAHVGARGTAYWNVRLLDRLFGFQEIRVGALRMHVDSDRLNEHNLHAELGQVVAGLKPGRERDDETILLWHRGLSITDIALGHALLEKAKRRSIGQTLRFA